jgi:hypothetical protein
MACAAASGTGCRPPIFDKEKEQQRIKEAQLIGEIGSQAAGRPRRIWQSKYTNWPRMKKAAQWLMPWLVL